MVMAGTVPPASGDRQRVTIARRGITFDVASANCQAQTGDDRLMATITSPTADFELDPEQLAVLVLETAVRELNRERALRPALYQHLPCGGGMFRQDGGLVAAASWAAGTKLRQPPLSRLRRSRRMLQPDRARRTRAGRAMPPVRHRRLAQSSRRGGSPTPR